MPSGWPAATGAILVVLALIGLGRVLPAAPMVAAARGGAATPSAAAGPSAAAVTQEPSPAPPALAPLRFRATALTVATEGFFSWALMDRRTGEIWGSATIAGTTWPASMIKPWLVADNLRRTSNVGRTPSAAWQRTLEIAIRDSDNNAAQAIYVANGATASIRRLISLCRLTDTTASSAGWSFTNISARDAVRMADCLANGTAAGPVWTAWVLEQMRTIRVGDFGIRTALSATEAATVSAKNGWLFYDDDKKWHINCMAVTQTWAMAVLQRYPGHGQWDSDFKRGQDVCRQVASQLRNPDYLSAG